MSEGPPAGQKSKSAKELEIIDEHVRRVVADASPLSDEQRAVVRAALALPAKTLKPDG